MEPTITVGFSALAATNRLGHVGARGSACPLREKLFTRYGHRKPYALCDSTGRHYLGEPSPLADVLLRYAEFFALFGDFAGYVKFFLLEDVVEDDGQTIRFFHPFADLSTPAVPKDRYEYLEYLRLSNAFISAPNPRNGEEVQGRIAR